MLKANSLQATFGDRPSFCNPQPAEGQINFPHVRYAKLTASLNRPPLEKKKLSTRDLLYRLSNDLAMANHFGQYNGERHYLNALNLLLLSTRELQHRKDFFQQLIKEQVKSFDHMLEVGVGNGEITPITCAPFRQATLVDTSIRALESIENSVSLKALKIKKIHHSILGANLRSRSFNLATLSHMLYYIDPMSWTHCLSQVYKTLKPGGLMVIVLSGGLDETALGTAFGGSPCDINRLLTSCTDVFPDDAINVLDINEKNYANNINDMLSIAGVYLNHAGTTADKQSLINYLNTFNREGEGFSFRSIQRFITVKKPTM